MNRSSKRAAVAAGFALSLAFSSGAVRAAVLNFDDIPVPDPRASVFVPNTYQGFDFTSNTTDSEFFVEPDADYKGTTSFYQNTYGAPSAPNAIANHDGQAILSIARSTPFNFTGVSASSFAGFDVYQDESAKTLTITGSRAGVPVGTPVVATLSPSGYNFLTANFTNVDKVTFTAAGAVPGPGNFYLLDNFTYTEVPEPASLSLMGLASLGLLRRRRGA